MNVFSRIIRGNDHVQAKQQKKTTAPTRQVVLQPNGRERCTSKTEPVSKQKSKNYA
jgi:hypothetical protein